MPDNLPEEQPSKQDLFIEYLSTCETVKEAALAAGYSESYATKTIYSRMKSHKFADRIRERYNGHAVTLLPKLANIDTAIINHLADNPLDAPKYKDTQQRILQVAGVLQDTPVMVNPTFTYVDLRTMVTTARTARISSDPIDVTPTDSPTE